MKYVITFSKDMNFIGEFHKPNKIKCLYCTITGDLNVYEKLDVDSWGRLYPIIEHTDKGYKIYDSFADLIQDYPQLILL